MNKKVKIVGAGLAGCEAAYQLLKRGFSVEMYEMRPLKSSSAHTTSDFAELVCSNSLKSDDRFSSSGLLKTELRVLDSLLIGCAEETRIEAGSALAVDRRLFSEAVEKRLSAFDGFSVVRKEVCEISDDEPIIYATGPLTSDALYNSISETIGESLHFYDAVAPIVDAATIDYGEAFKQDRYGGGDGDYLNCPLSKDMYSKFYNALISAETVPLKGFEPSEIFEGCMPVEVMAKRGFDTLRYGMMKPVGLCDSRTGDKPYAVVQLRKETKDGSAYNIVGFQTNLKYAEQKRVFSMIPALKNAEFLRYGIMHRNSYINSPGTLDARFKLIGFKNIYFAGQITGVEGYVESIAGGLLAAIHIARELTGREILIPPADTMCGALSDYVAHACGAFEPMNANFGILPAIDEKNRSERKKRYCLRAEEQIIAWEKLIN